jgi:hypothetical protein
MNILDHISESLETSFWVKILKFFDAYADPGSENLFDPGSGMEKFRSGIRNEHSGSATLAATKTSPKRWLVIDGEIGTLLNCGVSNFRLELFVSIPC